MRWGRASLVPDPAYLPGSRHAAAAEAAAPAVRAAFTAAGFDSQAWVTPLTSPGARLL